MKRFYLVLFLISPLCLWAQKTISTSGNWTNGASWLGGVPASGDTDNVTMNNATAITVRSGENIVAGSLTAGDNNTLTVDPTGTLTIGSSTQFQNLTAGNSMAIVANDGVIIIWGNLVVNNSLAITIQGPDGEIIIRGNVMLASGASLIVNGRLQVDGDFTGGNNTNVTVGVGGSINVDGTLTVGPGSNVNLNCDYDINGDPIPGSCGTFHAHACGPGPATASFCGTLPVEMISFSATPSGSSVKLAWATASELNNDHFEVETSSNGLKFDVIAHVAGAGTVSERRDYEVLDFKQAKGKYYYRLRQVDTDGKFSYSKVVKVLITENPQANLTVLPNPVKAGNVRFVLGSFAESNQPLAIEIIDFFGKRVGTIQGRIDQNGMADISVDHELPKGFYLVRALSARQVVQTKIIVD